MTTLQVAKTLHYAVSGFKVAIGEAPYPTWETLTDIRQKFLIDAVPFVINMAKFESSHEKRCEYVHDYWMEWTAINDPSHSSLIPYSELSDTEKIKDGLVVNAILACKDYIDDK